MGSGGFTVTTLRILIFPCMGAAFGTPEGNELFVFSPFLKLAGIPPSRVLCVTCFAAVDVTLRIITLGRTSVGDVRDSSSRLRFRVDDEVDAVEVVIVAAAVAR